MQFVGARGGAFRSFLHKQHVVVSGGHVRCRRVVRVPVTGHNADIIAVFVGIAVIQHAVRTLQYAHGNARTRKFFRFRARGGIYQDKFNAFFRILVERHGVVAGSIFVFNGIQLRAVRGKHTVTSAHSYDYLSALCEIYFIVHGSDHPFSAGSVQHAHKRGIFFTYGKARAVFTGGDADAGKLHEFVAFPVYKHYLIAERHHRVIAAERHCRVILRVDNHFAAAVHIAPKPVFLHSQLARREHIVVHGIVARRKHARERDDDAQHDCKGYYDILSLHVCFSLSVCIYTHFGSS